MSAFIKSVEYVEITLTGSTAVSVNLTKSQTIGDCVPFFTINLASGTSDTNAARCPEIYFEAGPKITARRGSSSGTAIVGVFVVEFDTGVVSVQQGTFSVADTDSSEDISSVTTTKAFCIIAYRSNDFGDDFDDGQVKVKFNSATQLGFNRIAGAGTITGRYYVVSTTGSEFSVQHVTMSIAAGTEIQTDVISEVTLAKTFVYNTFNSESALDDIDEGGLIIDLSDTTHVRARRASDTFSDTPTDTQSAATIETQIISAGDTEFAVERNECDWGDSTTAAVAITEIDQAKAIVVPGGYMGVMSSKEQDGNDIDGNYAILDFTSDTEVTGTRGANTDPDGVTMFEVVEFVLAAVGPPPTISLVMAPHIPT